MHSRYLAVAFVLTGALHLHLLLFVQSMHQHSSFQDVLDNLKLDPSHLERYFDYKNHVDCELYYDVDKFNSEQTAIEEGWPLHKDNANLLLQAKNSDLPKKEWERVFAKAVQLA